MKKGQQREERRTMTAPSSLRIKKSYALSLIDQYDLWQFLLCLVLFWQTGHGLFCFNNTDSYLLSSKATFQSCLTQHIPGKYTISWRGLMQAVLSGSSNRKDSKRCTCARSGRIRKEWAREEDRKILFCTSVFWSIHTSSGIPTGEYPISWYLGVLPCGSHPKWVYWNFCHPTGKLLNHPKFTK